MYHNAMHAHKTFEKQKHLQPTNPLITVPNLTKSLVHCRDDTAKKVRARSGGDKIQDLIGVDAARGGKIVISRALFERRVAKMFEKWAVDGW